MNIKILGSGTSTGVPEVGCTCDVCLSQNPKDKRSRTSALIQTGDATILIDCGPDFREQMLHTPFGKIDGVLITHEHYDHVSGLDDLRPFNRFGNMPIYSEAHTANHLRTRMPYCFAAQQYPGIPHLLLEEIEINRPFFINRTEILPLRVIHGKFPITGFRIGNMAYITDMLTMSAESFKKLEGLDVLILNALRVKPHISHQTIPAALETAKRITAKETYLIHMSHQAGLHNELEQSLPEHIHVAFDGMIITI
ncbi:Phosphoribosyl 1 2-cyclic phosphodiesterase [termite gut metagenome]|uniref:Phosphoribosyl 1 2-cyclic phosphodiesterase n=1 Tax=termite gut metagenome TaxID=433724 RepID=A0A5J4S193_9ZZZZ